MGTILRIRLREKRVLVILCALMSYVLLLFLNAQYVFPPTGASSAIFLPWVRFGFSALVALLFLSVGALVWLSARNRLVARLLFCFCAAMMLSFSVQTAAKADVPLFSVIGEISSISALFTFAVLLLVFPRNYLSSYTVSGTTNSGDELRHGLAQQVCKAVRSGSGEQADWLDARGDMIARLTAASRPLFLSEACRGDAEGPMGLMRYMAASTTAAGDDPLLAPIWAKGEMIGVLVLGKRGDHQAYAGPDFEAISLILARYASDLDNARLALDLRIAYERQKELDRLKDQFIVTASHELRTPLTAVQGYIELLADLDQELAPQMRAEFLRTVRRSCDELTLMVGNIMDAGRVEIDARQVRVGPVPLAQPVLRCGEILDGLIRGEKRTLHVDVSPALYVMADDFRLRQVLLNLIGNALKYSPPGTNVEVTCDQCDEQVTVRVRDYGSGVPPEDQARLFHRFVRLERDMNSPVRGAGLGLYISKQLIEAMGGHIWVESTGVPGEGSTFSFTLNAVPVNAEREGTNQVGVEGR